MHAGRPSAKSRYIEDVKRRYCDEQRSLGEISRELHISVQTLSRWLTSENIDLEPRPRNPNAGRSPEQQLLINEQVSRSRTGKGTGLRVQPQKGRCENCQTDFIIKASGQRYCSRSCARKVEGVTSSEINEARWLASSTSLCPCGNARIPYAVRHTTKYCSPECRTLYRAKSGTPRNEANHITFECQNCGAAVTRPRTYGAFKYCSTDCARRHTKTKKHFTVDGTTVLDSGYEVFFWGLCAILKIPIQRYDRDQGFQWKEGAWYAPDFLVGIRGVQYPVEIKGIQDDDDQERWRLFREQRGPLIVIQQEDLLRWASRRAEFLVDLTSLIR